VTLEFRKENSLGNGSKHGTNPNRIVKSLLSLVITQEHGRVIALTFSALSTKLVLHARFWEDEDMMVSVI
jgi:hypothetical protein